MFATECIEHIASRLDLQAYSLFVDITTAGDLSVGKWLFYTVFNCMHPSDLPRKDVDQNDLAYLTCI